MSEDLGPVSDHFDGQRFFNPEPIVHRRGDLMRWLRTRRSIPWRPVTDFTPPPPPPAHSSALRVTWINHATVLIQVNGVNMITDPVFSPRVSPFRILGPRRYHPPGVAFESLPAIDCVLISHAHYDHLDRATVGRLGERDNPLFVAGLGLRHWLDKAGARRVETLDWWQSTPIGASIRVTGVPARHWSQRGIRDRNRSLWLGFWVTTPFGDIYFAGDTGMGEHFAAIRARLGAPRLALLPIGAYEPRWFMAPQHMNPADAVAAHRILAAQRSLGIHFGTFKLSDESRLAPVKALASAREAAGLDAETFTAPAFGERFIFD